MEIKYAQAEFKVDASTRLIEGYASKRTRDLGGDVVAAGAFSKTVSERKDRILVLRDHDPKRIVGRPVVLEEDSTGLYTKSIIAKTPLGDETLQLVAEGCLSGMSIGYDPAPSGVSYEAVDGKQTRVLREVKLYEYSFVPFPMNEDARVTSVKSMTDIVQLLAAMTTARDLLTAQPVLGRAEKRLLWQLVDEAGAMQVDLKALLREEPADAVTPDGEAPVAEAVDPEVLSGLHALLQTLHV